MALCSSVLECRSVSLSLCEVELHDEQHLFDAQERRYSEPHAQDWMN